jgi:small-conductance mechanosensitive channel
VTVPAPDGHLLIAGACAAIGVTVIPWVLRQPTRTRISVGVVYLILYTYALIRAGILPVQPAPNTFESELRAFVQALQLFWWFIFARCLIALGRTFLLFKHKLHERKFATDLLSGFVYLAVLFAVVRLVFELPVTGLIATSGVVAIVLGLALQSTVSDLFSGIALSLEGAYRIGDSIGLEGDVQGTVIEISWRATHIMTWAQDTVVVPNSVIAKSRIINYSFPVRVHGVKFAISLDDRMPPAQGIEMLEQAVVNCRHSLRSPLPEVLTTGIGASSIDYSVCFFVESVETATQAISDVLDLIYRHAAWSGISLARERQDVRVIAQVPDSKPARTVLDRMPLLAVLSAAERDTLLTALKRRELRGSETVFEEGEAGDSLFLIERGVVSMSRRAAGGTTEELARLGPGQYFGENALSGAPRNATVRALTHAIVYEIARVEVAPILKAHPELESELDQAFADLRRSATASLMPEPGVDQDGLPAGRIFERIGRLLGH